MENLKTTVRALIFMLAITILSGQLFAQQLVTFKMRSNTIKDSIPVKVWLPAGYNPNASYPVVYEFIYDHANFISATLDQMYDLPKTIVVYAEIVGGNDHYSNPNLTGEGDNYYSFIKNELLQYITLHYHTTYRIAVGLSQGADYINYILRNDPQMFDCYLNFSIERPITYTPDFNSYTAKVNKPIAYFIGVADDIPERKKFADQLSDSLQKNKNLRIKKLFYPNASHSYSILYGLADALQFTFEDYQTLREPLPVENIHTYFQNVFTEKTKKYGNLNYGNLIIKTGNLINRDIPVSALDTLVNTINDNPYTTDIDFFNLGYSFFQKGLYEEAEKSFTLSLQKQKAKTIKMSKASIYSWLSKANDKMGKDSTALANLEEGYEETKDSNDGFLLYRLGSFMIDKKLQPRKGIENLEALLAGLQQNKLQLTFFTKDIIYTKIAKGYLLLHDKKQAKQSVARALDINAVNKEAIDLQALLK